MRTWIESQSRTALASLLLGLAVTSSASAADLYVPAGYSTIQAAVNAATNGDMIHIAAGVYAGQVLISNKSLALLGSPGAVLRATAGMSQPYTALGFTWVPLLGILRSEVVVSNLTFEGEHLADSQAAAFTGIYYLGSGGRVEDCRISGFRGSSLGSGFGNGMRVLNKVSLGTGVVTIQVLRSTFADNLNSLQLRGDSNSSIDPTFDPTLLRTTFTVSDNTLTGNGPDGAGNQVGLVIDAGAAGEVSRNTISDHSYIGTDSDTFAFGIVAEDGVDFGNGPLAALQPIRFQGNVFRNNQVHLAVLRGDASTIVNNSCEGTAPGARLGGLCFSGQNVMVGTNRFTDMPLGVLLFGTDPVYDTYLGIASNATLIANGFCHVATNYVYEPMTSYTEQDTLTCPPPILDIRAVQLSWPYYYNGYSVEIAPNDNGPWTASGAKVFQQEGQNRSVVPMNSERQFFRLRNP